MYLQGIGIVIAEIVPSGKLDRHFLSFLASVYIPNLTCILNLLCGILQGDPR